MYDKCLEKIRIVKGVPYVVGEGGGGGGVLSIYNLCSYFTDVIYICHIRKLENSVFLRYISLMSKLYDPYNIILKEKRIDFTVSMALYQCFLYRAMLYNSCHALSYSRFIYCTLEYTCTKKCST